MPIYLAQIFPGMDKIEQGERILSMNRFKDSGGDSGADLIIGPPVGQEQSAVFHTIKGVLFLFLSFKIVVPCRRRDRPVPT